LTSKLWSCIPELEDKFYFSFLCESVGIKKYNASILFKISKVSIFFAFEVLLIIKSSKQEDYLDFKELKKKISKPWTF
jgi:hypothetical protein